MNIDGTPEQFELDNGNSDISIVAPTPSLPRLVRQGAHDANGLQALSRAGPVRPRRATGANPQVRNWCFTLNNPQLDGEQLLGILTAHPNFRFCVFQLEAGDSGTPHFQGYLQFGTVQRFNTLKGYLRSRNIEPHLEPANGTPDQNVTYCTKEPRIAGPWQEGQMSSMGKRTDILMCAKMLADGASMEQVAAEHPATFIANAGGLYKYKRTCAPPPLMRPMDVSLFIGPTGTGKTHQACMELGEDCFIKDSTKWWECYNGQKKVLWDDFAGAASHVTLTEALRLFDKYRMTVENKGGSEWLATERQIVTTNIHPWNWYRWEGRELQLPALARRFTKVRVFRSIGSWTDLTETDSIMTFFEDPERFGFEKHAPESKN